MRYSYDMGRFAIGLSVGIAAGVAMTACMGKKRSRMGCIADMVAKKVEDAAGHIADTMQK